MSPHLGPCKKNKRSCRSVTDAASSEPRCLVVFDNKYLHLTSRFFLNHSNGKSLKVIAP